MSEAINDDDWRPCVNCGGWYAGKVDPHLCLRCLIVQPRGAKKAKREAVERDKAALDEKLVKLGRV